MKTPNWNIRKWPLAVTSLFVIAVGCGGPQTYSKSEMASRQQAKVEQTPAPKASRAPIASMDPNEVSIPLGEEITLIGGKHGKIVGTEIIIRILKTDWITVETSRGENKSGLTTLLVTRGEESKTVTIEESDFGYAFGHRIDVSAATEEWDDVLAKYQPMTKLRVSPQ